MKAPNQPLSEAGQKIHQHISMLNFRPRRWLIFLSRVTSSVLKSVTIGIGAFIHISKAYARVVSFGFTSCIIFLMQNYTADFTRDRRNETSCKCKRICEKVGIGCAKATQCVWGMAAECLELTDEMRLVGISAVSSHGGIVA